MTSISEKEEEFNQKMQTEKEMIEEQNQLTKSKVKELDKKLEEQKEYIDKQF
jgi:hypothetical protein